MASGPSANQRATYTEDAKLYSTSVMGRAMTSPPGDWDRRIRLYKEDLFAGRWRTASKWRAYEKETADFPQDRKESARFRCPVTVIYGMQDLALDPRITLDGIERVFFETDEADGGQSSRFIRLPNCGHWSLLEPEGEAVLQSVLKELTERNC